MKLYGSKKLELADNEYAVLASFSSMMEYYDYVLADKPEINVFGNTLTAKTDKCIYGFIRPSGQPMNTGVFIVPDSAVDESGAGAEILVGNFNASDKKGIAEAEKSFCEKWDKVMNNRRYEDEISKYGYMSCMLTRQEIADDAVGVSALVTFLGLYIGFIFLVSCGAILALKELSESADSIPRYTMLRKLGVEEREIKRSVFRQSGIFFLLPLLLACIHSYFGMRFGRFMLEMLVNGSFIKPIIFTSSVIVAIYGGYFLLTFICSKAIIKEQK
jgi:putative ABC transport system permease protein